MQLPSLRFSAYTAGSESQKQAFCKELFTALSTFGFVKLTDHGISRETIEALFRWNQEFFALPLATKLKGAHPVEPNPHRGYSYVGQELLSRVAGFEKGQINDTAIVDVKESLDLGPANDTLYPNRWVPDEDLPGFRAFVEKFYEQCHATHMRILEAIATSLKVPPTTFSTICNNNTSELRLNHYPPVSTLDLLEGKNRISEHTDFGTITLLFQDTVGGLEIEDQANLGSFYPVEARDRAELILNVGDCLQRWTNNILRSASHRVVMPEHLKLVESEEKLPDRYSVAYFGKPDREMLVSSMPEFVSASTPARYTDKLTAWEYNQLKLNRTYQS